MERNYKVYMHVFPNDKVYIGITKTSVKKRWLNGKGYKTSRKLNFAINKYGWENIQHKILYENLTKEEAEQKEIELIKKYNSTNDKFGYNIENGGNHQGKMSEDTKKKISEVMKGKLSGINNGMYGKHHSLETRKKMSENNSKYMLGKHLSDEIKKKISIANKGKIVSEETKNKIKKTQTEKGIRYSTEEERHLARLESFKKYKEKHKKEISEYNKKYRLEHKNK